MIKVPNKYTESCKLNHFRINCFFFFFLNLTCDRNFWVIRFVLEMEKTGLL